MKRVDDPKDLHRHHHVCFPSYEANLCVLLAKTFPFLSFDQRPNLSIHQIVTFIYITFNYFEILRKLNKTFQKTTIRFIPFYKKEQFSSFGGLTIANYGIFSLIYTPSMPAPLARDIKVGY
jgi:hypothetical protein